MCKGRILLSIIVVVIIGIMVVRPATVDNIVLLENRHPTYWQLLGSQNTIYVENENDNPYALTFTNKEGFENITPDDLKYYIKATKNRFPKAKHTIIAFLDGDGIDILKNDITHAVYGVISRGRIDVERELDITIPLQSQICGITTRQCDYDENGKPIYELWKDTNGNAEKMPGGYYAIRQKWDGDHLSERTYLDIDNRPTVRSDGYSRVIWDRTNDTWRVHFKDINGKEIPIEGLNLVQDIRSGYDEWSEWMIPQNDVSNSCFYIGTINLGEKKKGMFIHVRWKLNSGMLPLRGEKSLGFGHRELRMGNG